MLIIAGGCAPAGFYQRLTPSGVPCPDMPIFAYGQNPERPIHRLRPVESSIRDETGARSIETLRKKACQLGGDAVVEVMSDEFFRGSRRIRLLSGTAARFDPPAPTGP